MKRINRTPTVFAVGAFPPPVHGLSSVNIAMATLLKEDAKVVTFNTAQGRGGRSITSLAFKVFNAIHLPAKFLILVIKNKPRTLYLALSGSKGQLRDAVFLYLARVLGVKIFIHHHSFRYVVKFSKLTRFLFWISKDATHIVLCDDMAKQLNARYIGLVNRILVISNAAIIKTSTSITGLSKPRSYRENIKIGFLSNITREKGIFHFFDIVEKLELLGVSLTGVIAGPVSGSIHEEFFERVSVNQQIQYVGPVYNDKKDEFFEDLDFLVFPSQYENEAEPLTVIEALNKGIPVLASARGCIPSMLAAGGGYFFADDEFLSNNISMKIKSLCENPSEYRSLSNAALENAKSRLATNTMIERIIQSLVGETPSLGHEPNVDSADAQS
jgi:glycosyltransferase involved in cell wall biosynthesis